MIAKMQRNSLSFCRYCSRSSLTIMAGVGVAHKLPKKKKKKIQYKSLIKPPQLKLFTSSPQGQAYQAMSLPNPRSLYFGLKPINRLRRDSFGCKSIPSYNCPGEERKFQPVHISIRTVILKRMESGTPVTSSLRQVPIFLSIVTRLLCILSKKVKETCCLRSWSSDHWSSSSISPTRLWLRQCLQAQQAAVLWTFSINFCLVMGWLVGWLC